MKRRAFLGLGSALVAASAVGGWTLTHHTEQPLLLSARNDADGRHYAVGYRLDGSQVFATPVAERCHDVYAHPHLPLAVFVGRRPSRESYLIDSRDGTLLQRTTPPKPAAAFSGSIVSRVVSWCAVVSIPPTASARISCCGCRMARHW